MTVELSWKAPWWPVCVGVAVALFKVSFKLHQTVSGVEGKKGKEGGRGGSQTQQPSSSPSFSTSLSSIPLGSGCPWGVFLRASGFQQGCGPLVSAHEITVLHIVGLGLQGRSCCHGGLGLAEQVPYFCKQRQDQPKVRCLRTMVSPTLPTVFTVSQGCQRSYFWLPLKARMVVSYPLELDFRWL